MSRVNVVIIDTGCANITSVQCAFARLCDDVTVSRDPATIRQASHIVLPGVGTAGAAMKNLALLSLIPLIKSLTQPVLGICLGMQLLTQLSHESDINCLGLIEADVLPLPKKDKLPLPHMGWNKIAQLTGPLFRGLDDNNYVYFVHSFAVPVGEYSIAQSDYGTPFSAAINSNNFYGVQFHPERSGQVGSTILANFLAIELA